MLVLNADVFEEMIVGTTQTWYSYAQFNDALGSSDRLLILAFATNVSGAPKVNVFYDESIDGRMWSLGGLNLVGTTPLVNGTILLGFANDSATFGRLRITLTGTSAGLQCRLKLSVAGRSE